jgi:hypothetical protein
MSGQSDSFRALLTTQGEWFTPNDAPRIGDFDALLEALRREHDEPRTDLAVQLVAALDAARCDARYRAQSRGF